jgi:DNA-binding CsgD family transcriptional regulator
LSHREIAAQLKISPFTVRNHVINIMDKIGIRTNVGIVTWYIDSILFIKYGSNFLSLAEEAIQ